MHIKSNNSDNGVWTMHSTISTLRSRNTIFLKKCSKTLPDYRSADFRGTARVNLFAINYYHLPISVNLFPFNHVFQKINKIRPHFGNNISNIQLVLKLTLFILIKAQIYCGWSKDSLVFMLG